MVSPDEGSSVSARSGNGPSESIEIYGPIGLKRYVKGDGRALILYARGESPGGGPAHGGDDSYRGDDSISAHEGHERA
jgi:hypothetical protein